MTVPVTDHVSRITHHVSRIRTMTADCKNLEAAAENFNDFLYNYQKVARFYANYGRSVEPLADHARRVGAQQFDRKRVPDALDRINRRVGSPELTFKHIEMLRH